MCASFCFGCRVCHRCSQTQGTFTVIRVLDVAQSFSIVRRGLSARLVRGLVTVSVATIHEFRCVSVD